MCINSFIKETGENLKISSIKNRAHKIPPIFQLTKENMFYYRDTTTDFHCIPIIKL